MSIKKSVKLMVIELLRRNGPMDLVDIYKIIRDQREVHEAHVRGVLNRDIQSGSKYFERIGRGKYSLASAPSGVATDK